MSASPAFSFSVQEICSWTGARVANEKDWLQPALQREVRVERPAALPGATRECISFFFSKSYQSELLSAHPGVLLTGEAFVEPLRAAKLPFWNQSVVIACAHPYLAMAQVLEHFAVAPQEQRSAGIHPSAVIHPEAKVGEGASIGPFCTVGARTLIGADCVLFPGVHIGADCELGSGCVIFPQVVLYDGVKVGKRVRIHAGSVIGADGFGYAQEKMADGRVIHRKIHHLGKVIIGDDVEIGANVCVDRATLGETRIDQGAKIDNLVQIAHNAQVGESSIMCGHSGLAGSAKVGKYVMIAGMAGVDNQVSVGDGAVVGAYTSVTKDMPPLSKAVGIPQRTHRDHFRIQALMNKMLLERSK